MPNKTGVYITASLPSGFTYNNTCIIGLRVVRVLDGSIWIYSNDGCMGNAQINDGKVKFAATQDGVTYCSGCDISAILIKIK